MQTLLTRKTYHVSCGFLWFARGRLRDDYVPPPLQLTWRTVKVWMGGEPVLMFSIIQDSLKKCFENLVETSELFLVLLKRSGHRRNRVGNNFIFSPQEMCFNWQCIDDIYWDKGRQCLTRVSFNKFEQSKDIVFSFLLVKDHGFPLNACLYTSDICTHSFSTLQFFIDFAIKEVTNVNPYVAEALPEVEAKASRYVLHCFEWENRCEVDIGIRSNVAHNVNNIAITTNCQYPAVSAHTLTLTIVGNSESLAFTVSWPFLVDGIESTIEMETKKKRNSKWLHLVMKKSLNDAWPAGFGGRSKWDTDLLIKPWRDFPSNGTLKMHIEAQFDCFQILHRIARYSIKSVEWCEPSSTATATTQSRLISLPFTTTANWMCMSSISASIQADRFTPQGSPLLLVSVINHRLARQFIEQGKLDSEENQFEFHRIITERVSREVRIIRTSSEKEMDLFIDVLCVNSTKMRRGTWQSKNLLRCEYSPRMPIFVSPLYIEHICKECSLAHSD